MKKNKLEELHFENTFHQLGAHFYTSHSPHGLKNPKLVCVNQTGLELLEINPSTAQANKFLHVASGNEVLPEFRPLAQDYAGHQYGKFNPLLGDGRSLLLGQITTSENRCWDLVLKGSGKTAYSREHDGRASLRSCIHEFLISSALHGLGIPTTHSLSICVGDELVYRQGFKQTAMLLRVARSHIRFGTFENYYFQKNKNAIQKLADHVIQYIYPECKQNEKPYVELFEIIIKNTAELIANWQAYGFVHGVMNTDNFTISGESLDLMTGQFLGKYQANYVIDKLIDEHGMFAFDQQPIVGLWNCNALARCFSYFLERDQIIATLSIYEPYYQKRYYEKMRSKIGICEEGIKTEDEKLIDDYCLILEKEKLDYSKSFIALEEYENNKIPDYFLTGKVDMDLIKSWFERYSNRLDLQNINRSERILKMKKVNPIYILHKEELEKIIVACEQGDYTSLLSTVKKCQQPFISMNYDQ